MPKILEIGFYISVALVAVMLYQKKKKKPSKLSLTAYKDESLKLKGIRKVQAQVVDEAPANTKSDVFRFNGQSYSALQVLGLPLGAEADEIKKAFAVKSSQDSKKSPLYKKAYLHLKKNQNF